MKYELHVIQPICYTIRWSFLQATLDSFTILNYSTDRTSFAPIVVISCHIHLNNVCGELPFHIFIPRGPLALHCIVCPYVQHSFSIAPFVPHRSSPYTTQVASHHTSQLGREDEWIKLSLHSFPLTYKDKNNVHGPSWLVIQPNRCLWKRECNWKKKLYSYSRVYVITSLCDESMVLSMIVQNYGCHRYMVIFMVEFTTYVLIPCLVSMIIVPNMKHLIWKLLKIVLHQEFLKLLTFFLPHIIPCMVGLLCLFLQVPIFMLQGHIKQCKTNNVSISKWSSQKGYIIF